MKIKRSPYISDEISKQYPIDELKGLIINVIDIVENFILELGDENKYNSSSTARYEECIGSHQFSTSSKIDIMKLNNDRYCINILNGGFDALIAENMNKFRWVPFLSGTGKYNAAIFYTLVLWKGYTLAIKVDDKKFKGKYTLFAISNARYYGGGVVPCKNATPDDGILSICLVKNTSIFEKVILLPKYKASKHENISKVYINDEVKKINIHSNVDFPLSIDGEVSMVKDLECAIIPEAINIVKIKKETKI